MNIGIQSIQAKLRPLKESIPIRKIVDDPKRAESQQLRRSEITKQNELLFNKIVSIFSHKPKRSCSVMQSRLKNHKVMEQQIMNENLRLFSKLQKQKSSYAQQQLKPRGLPHIEKGCIKLFSTQLVQNQALYKIEITVDHDRKLFQISCLNDKLQKILEMNKYDGLNMLKNRFKNDLTLFVQAITITDKIRITGLELIDDV